jgi:hypothetical protein
MEGRNLQESITSFFSLIEDIIETTMPSQSNAWASTKISKRKQYGLNDKNLVQFLLVILQILFQMIILVVNDIFSNKSVTNFRYRISCYLLTSCN